MVSVILLTVDCLRADHLGCYGYHRPTSPHIDAFAEEATQYKYSYSNCPGTRWAFQSLHTGVTTARVDGLGIPNDYQPLATHLQQTGYTTGGFADNGFVSRDYGYHTGFDEYYSVRDTQEEEPSVVRLGKRVMRTLDSPTITKHVLEPARELIRQFETDEDGFYQANHTDADTVDTALEFIKKQQASNSDYFAWIHFMDAHTPYSYWPEHLDALNVNTNRHTINPDSDNLVAVGEAPDPLVIDVYDACIREVDRQVSRVLDLLDNETTVIFTGDHGEEFGRYGRFHNASLHSSMTNVPIIVRSPDIETGVSSMPVQHLDIPPTLLTAAGIEPPAHWEGIALQAEARARDNPLFFTLGSEEIAVQLDGWKYIRKGGEETLYKVGHGDAEVPGADAKSENSEILSRCRTLVNEYLNRPTIGEGTLDLNEGRGDLSDEVEGNLEDLGYI